MRKFALATACSAIAITAVPAMAQTSGLAEEAEQQDELAEGEIVVTANRTASLLSETPIAITAITGDDLADENITNPTQLEDTVPNLSIVRGNGLQITIRGVTSADGTEKGDPSAAFNLNGVYIARPQAQEVSFYDIERVEVLRGPQGTLYGRNATAGVVNVISTRPKFDFGGSVDASYGNFDSLFATAVINAPLGDTFAVRAAANIDRRDSFVIDGAPDDGVEYGRFKDNKSVRLSALFEPNSDLSVYFVGDYSKLEGTQINFVPGGNFFDLTTLQPLENTLYIDSNDDAQRTNLTPFFQQPQQDSETWGVTGEIEYVLGDASITYLGGYREGDTQFVGVLSNGLRGYGQGFTTDQQSHELRIAYDGGPLQAQAGVYYFREESDQRFEIVRAVGTPGAFLSFLQNPTVSKSKAAFGQLTYEVTPSFRLTGGLRYTEDTKSRIGRGVITEFEYVNNSTDFGPQSPISTIFAGVFGTTDNPITLSTNIAERTFDQVTWRLGADYDTSLGLLFASVSTGYKAGGFNDGCSVETGVPGCNVEEDFLYYDPEKITSYEAGFKFRFSPEFALNGTAFHYDYSSLQLTQLVLNFDGNGNNAQITTNAARAKVDGLELDATLRPGDRWTFNLAFNYLDARYDDFVPGSIGGEPVQLAGRALNRSPKTSGRAAVNYNLPVGGGYIDFNASTRFSAAYDLSGDFATFYQYEQPSFTKTDLSVKYSAPGDRFYVGAFVENLEDDLVLTSGSATGAIFADPRTYGVRAGVQF